MFRLSRKSALAIEAVADIAYHGKTSPVPSRDFTARLKIPRRHLEPVLQALVRAEVLKSLRGPKGGYVLARERRRITIGDIVRAAGTVSGVDDPVKSALNLDIVQPILFKAQEEALTALDAVTIDELLARAEQRGLLSTPVSKVEAQDSVNYTI
ncbi:MAG: Rrf2 family transcriptional regulator [Pseudomonadota bacterium]